MSADRAGADSVAQARAKMLGAITPCGAELIALEAGAGRTLAETLRAPRAQPPFRSSAMDGYGVRASDLALGRFTVQGEAQAGRAFAGAPLAPGGAVRVFTGAPVPDEVDLVVPQELARREGATLWLDPSAPLRRNIRAAGIDFERGAMLVQKGTRLHARHLALIAAAGCRALSVARAPRIGLLATGNEIVVPGAPAAAHEIFDSVSYGLGAMIESWGGVVRRLGVRPDAAPAIAAAVAGALGAVELQVIIGGASAGDYDVVKESLAALGVEIAVPRIAVRPGKPTWFGKIGDTPVLGLPGNPAAALVCARLFLRPVIRALLGCDAADAAVPALLDGELGASGASEWYVRARARTDADARLRVRPYDNQDTSLVSVMAAANALIHRPAGAGAVASGTLVELVWLDGC